MPRYLRCLCPAVVLCVVAACARSDEPARALAGGLLQALVDHGHCQAIRPCIDMIDVSGAHSRIEVALVDSGDAARLGDAIEYIVEHGFVVTGGVPILVRIYAGPVGGDGRRALFGKRATTRIEITG